MIGTKRHISALQLWLASVGFASAISAALWSTLGHGNETYTDIVVGTLAWGDLYKAQDPHHTFSLLLCFIGISTAGFAFFRVTDDGNARSARIGWEPWRVTLFLLVSLIIPFIVLKHAIVRLVKLLTFLIFLSYLYVFLERRFAAASSQYRPSLIDWLTFVVFIFFSTMALYQVIGALSPELSVLMCPHGKELSLAALGLASVVGLWVVFIRRKLTDETWLKALVGSQVLIPLLLFRYAYVTYSRDGFLYTSPMNPPALAGLSLLILGAVFSSQLRFFRSPRNADPVLWTSVCAIGAFLAWKAPTFNPSGWDAFHVGEIMLPWQQIVELGQKLYRDFVSIQGLLAFIVDGLNVGIFQNSVGTFLQAFTLHGAIVCGLILYCLHRLVGGRWALLLVLIGLPLADRFYLVPIVVSLAANRRLLRHPTQWCALMFPLSVFHCFFSPAIGAASTLALAPFLALQLRRALFRRERLPSKPALIAGGVLLAFVTYLLLPNALGLLSFIRENGSTNEVAYGVPSDLGCYLPDWLARWFRSPADNQKFWHIFQIYTIVAGTWLLGYFAMLGQSQIRDSDRERSESGLQMTVVAGFGVLFGVVAIPYAMGRIDPDSMSRPGSVGILLLGYLVPLALILRYQGRKMPLRALALLGLLVGLGPTFSYKNYPFFAFDTFGYAFVPKEAKWADGAAMGLPRWGKLFLLKEDAKTSLTLKAVMHHFLHSGETYYDLTNRSLFYFILGMRCPSPYSADYVAANSEIQERVIAALEANRPPVTWIAPAIRHDGGPASLRSYRIYRWLLLHDYAFYEEGALKFMVRKDRLQELGIPPGQPEQLAEVFHLQNLQHIPETWGRNWKHLETRFVEVAHPKAGREADFLLLNCPSGFQEATTHLQWADDPGSPPDNRAFEFAARGKDLLVPMGSDPRWLLDEKLGRVTTDARCRKQEPPRMVHLKLVR